MVPVKTIATATTLAILLSFGCSASNKKLATGMKMQDAILQMEQLGVVPQQMAIAEPHTSFELPDGRAVILFGTVTVDKIHIITNPEAPQSKRITKAVLTLTL